MFYQQAPSNNPDCTGGSRRARNGRSWPSGRILASAPIPVDDPRRLYVALNHLPVNDARRLVDRFHFSIDLSIHMRPRGIVTFHVKAVPETPGLGRMDHGQAREGGGGEGRDKELHQGCPLVLISLPPASTEVAAGQFGPCRKTRIAPGLPKGNETVTDTFLGRKLARPLPPGARRAGEVASRSGRPASPWGSEVGEVRGTGRPSLRCAIARAALFPRCYFR